VLEPTNIQGTVVSLLVNSDAADLTSQPVADVMATFEGFAGDIHAGLVRSSCTRVKRQYPKGTQIRNTRQISALCTNELAGIAHDMDVDHLKPGWLGANLLLDGIPMFSKLPPSSRLIFSNGAALVVDMENAPCRFPGDIIEQHYQGKGSRFARVARGRRGVTLWVEREGDITVGDTVKLPLPPPVSWSAE